MIFDFDFNLVVVAGSPVPGEALHVGRLYTVDASYDEMTRIDGKLSTLAQAVIERHDPAALLELAKQHSQCLPGCLHGDGWGPKPTGPFRALLSWQQIRWGRTVQDYRDPGNPMLSRVPELLDDYEELKHYGTEDGRAQADRHIVELREIYRLSLLSAAQHQQRRLAQEGPTMTQTLEGLAGCREEIRAVYARYLESTPVHPELERDTES